MCLSLIISSQCKIETSDRMLFKAARVLRLVLGLFPSRKMVFKVALFGGLAAGLRGYAALDWWAVALVLFAIYLATGGWRFTWICIATFPRDLKGLSVLIKMKLFLSRRIRNNHLIEDVFRETMKCNPDKTAFIMDDQKMTFRDVENYSNAVSNMFFERGYQKGDAVAVVIDNRPEYVPIWLGLSKIGAVGALINYNLRKDGLAHCISVANCKAVIFGTELSDAIKEILPSLKNVELFATGPIPASGNLGFNCFNFDNLVRSTSKLPPPLMPGRSYKDCAFYVYTSGTTGLPKAAVITHSRYLFMGKSMGTSFGLSSRDIVYSALPLYHSASGCLGTGQVIINGSTMALRKKFSASKFWQDCIKYNATYFQYIGEVCRYLYAQPYRPEETQHKIYGCFGNGLRPQIWKEFKERFRIKQIGEFYGATEGNGNVVNLDNTPGAVGFTSVIVPWAYPVFLIKINEETGDIVRDSSGLCIKTKPGEPGQLVGKIVKGDPVRDFHGYANSQANSKKVVYDVLKKGDSAFLSGDVLMMDKYGYMYFLDRSGDTFRWKGENVSTAEVESVISKMLGNQDAVVYGVEVLGSEGRAGMAAIVDPNNCLDVTSLYDKLKGCLPTYAIPIFVRLVSKVDTTGTFKLKKVAIRNEGYDPNRLSDRLYFLDPAAKRYKDLTPVAYQDILTGKIRL